MTPFAAHHMDDIRRLTKKSHDLGDLLKPHRTNPDIMLVSAQSLSTDAARVWYKVNIVTGTCTCKSFTRWANCRHLCRVSWELHKRQERPTNIIDFPAFAA